ncbi:MAG TPA: GNAT family N-acetyltransferase [Methylomirabilota bacterium]|nr:GNAT family N-acetyltransferase [Methylomirabilota bacterium]
MDKHLYFSSHLGYEELVVQGYIQRIIKLVTPEIKYAQDSLNWVRDKEVGQYTGADFSNVFLEGEKQRLTEITENKDGYNWIIECDGQAIGNVNISDIEKTSQEFGKKAGSLNYIIGVKELWNKGITSAVVKKVLEWAFKNSFEIIKSRVIPQNKSSRAVLLKSGFVEYGREDYDGPDIGEPTWYITYKLVK